MTSKKPPSGLSNLKGHATLPTDTQELNVLSALTAAGGHTMTPEAGKGLLTDLAALRAMENLPKPGQTPTTAQLNNQEFASHVDFDMGHGALRPKAPKP